MEIEGKEIVMTRQMNEEEMESEAWSANHVNPIVLILDDGTKLYPSQDFEGNGPGCMFGEKIRVY